MGSPDPVHARQLNGMGGGISSLSKIVVVGPPTRAHEADVDVEYTFVQVGIREPVLDYSGNCGNLSSMVGVFALDEGICAVPPGGPRTGTHATIRAFNTNTHKTIHTTFPISISNSASAAVLEIPETSIPGVPGRASAIKLDFLSPAGARTGRLLPTGSLADTLHVPVPPSLSSPSTTPDTIAVRASCIDASNPTVFVSLSTLPALHQPLLAFLSSTPTSDGTTGILELLESIRREGARRMRLDPRAQAQPKIAIVSLPALSPPLNEKADIAIHALSMGALHRAVPATVALCLGVAAQVEGSVVWDVVRRGRVGGSVSGSASASASGEGTEGQGRSTSGEGQGQEKEKEGKEKGTVRIRHPGGVVVVRAEVAGGGEVVSAGIVSTGRRLMRGAVWW